MNLFRLKLYLDIQYAIYIYIYLLNLAYIRRTGLLTLDEIKVVKSSNKSIRIGLQ